MVKIKFVGLDLIRFIISKLDNNQEFFEKYRFNAEVQDGANSESEVEKYSVDSVDLQVKLRKALCKGNWTVESHKTPLETLDPANNISKPEEQHEPEKPVCVSGKKNSCRVPHHICYEIYDVLINSDGDGKTRQITPYELSESIGVKVQDAVGILNQLEDNKVAKNTTRRRHETLEPNHVYTVILEGLEKLTHPPAEHIEPAYKPKISAVADKGYSL